jgi:S-methylmethionine-dependent homocysteine/selenocysteine methylase
VSALSATDVYLCGTARSVAQAERHAEQWLIGGRIFGGSCEAEAQDMARLHEQRRADRGVR